MYTNENFQMRCWMIVYLKPQEASEIWQVKVETSKFTYSGAHWSFYEDHFM
jgi:hypothetical protein